MTEQATSPGGRERPLRLAVDERRLLREFGRFFRSFESACEELVQNAYRAGATRIGFAVDHAARTLVVADDGPGSDDPVAFLTAGRTGWSDAVVEPAGLGLFALLGLSEEVRIESRRGAAGGWVAEVMAAAWGGAPVPLRRLPALDPSDHGLRLAARLKPSAGSLAVSPRFRHHFPLAVTWEETLPDGARRSQEYPRPAFPGPWLDTPVGRFGPDAPGWREHGLRLHLVWEHRVLASARPEQDLLAALRRLPDGAPTVEALGGQGFALLLEPSTGVRPVLPERQEVVRDSAYHRVIDGLARALVAALNPEGLRARMHELRLPRVLHEGEHEAGQRTGLDDPAAVRPRWAEGISHPVFGPVPNTCALRAAGYAEVGHADYTAPYLEREDDSWYAQFCWRTSFALDPLRLAEDEAALAEALCRAGFPAVAVAGGERLAVRVMGLRYAAGMRLATCEVLDVLGADGRVVARPSRLLLAERDATQLSVDGQSWRPDEYGGVALLRAAPADAVALCQRDEELLGWALRVVDEREEHDFYDYFLWEQEDIHWERLQRLLVVEVARGVCPEARVAAEKHCALAALAEVLADLRTRAEALRPDAERALAAYPDVGALATVPPALDGLVAAAQRLAAETAPAGH